MWVFLFFCVLTTGFKGLILLFADKGVKVRSLTAKNPVAVGIGLWLW